MYIKRNMHSDISSEMGPFGDADFKRMAVSRNKNTQFHLLWGCEMALVESSVAYR